MSTTKNDWRLRGEEVASCNCAWGCPCQFNSLPTDGHCEAMGVWKIERGHFGKTSLDGLAYAAIAYFPGAVHEGGGTIRFVVDAAANAEQRSALEALFSGKEGGGWFEIFAAVCPNRLETAYAPISIEVDRPARRASAKIAGIADTRIEPIKNPVSGEEHRAKIVLPNGFEYKEAEMGNSVSWKVDAGGVLSMAHENSYAQLNAFDWTNA